MRHRHGYKWGWLALVGVAAGCNAKLTVDPGTGGAQGFPAGAQNGTAGAQGDTAGAQNGTAGARHGTAGAQNATAGEQGIVAGDQGVGGGIVAGDQGVGGGIVAGYQGVGGVGGAQSIPYGDLGQNCIPEETVTDGNGVATAQINMPEHCLSGLACSDGSRDGSGGASAGHCIALAACPNARDLCVEQDVLDAGSNGGASGAGGAASTIIGGAGSDTAIMNEIGVTAMAVDATHLYWVQYGTRDSLGNYQNDGALKAMKFSDRSTITLASGIEGPNALAVTSGHVYVLTDGAGLVGSPVQRTLLRFPLNGGSSEQIQTGTPPLVPSSTPTLAVQGAVLYWGGSDSVYALADDATVPTILASNAAAQLAADDTTLFFQDSSDYQLKSVPDAGGTAALLGLDARPFALSGDSIYGLESVDQGMILSKAAKVNSSWLRVRALGAGTPVRLQFAGERFFYEGYTYLASQIATVSTGTLNASLPLTRLLEFNFAQRMPWVGTADTFYWTDARRIYARALAAP